jgi:hypothetical protein
MLQYQTDDAGDCERGTADIGHRSALSQAPALGDVPPPHRSHGHYPSAQLALPKQPRDAPLAGVPKLNLGALQAAIIQEPMQCSWAAASPAVEPVASRLMASGLGAFPPVMLQEPMQGSWAAAPTPVAEPVASWAREIQEPMVPIHYH